MLIRLLKGSGRAMTPLQSAIASAKRIVADSYPREQEVAQALLDLVEALSHDCLYRLLTSSNGNYPAKQAKAIRAHCGLPEEQG